MHRRTPVPLHHMLLEKESQMAKPKVNWTREHNFPGTIQFNTSGEKKKNSFWKNDIWSAKSEDHKVEERVHEAI